MLSLGCHFLAARCPGERWNTALCAQQACSLFPLSRLKACWAHRHACLCSIDSLFGEVIIAVFILLLLLTLAVPSLNGVLADKRLHRSLNRFNELVRQAHERSLAEHRAYLIVWNDVEVSLQPAAFLKTEPHQPIDTIA